MANSTEVPSRGATEVNDPAQFRYVLGQYPTGVTLITAAHPGGEPVGMVVGTFTSVSLDPPIVAFLPDRKSSSWPKIREAGSFCANVLTSAQQDICRAFARKQDDRFTSSRWETTASGSPRLQGAAAWIDCTIDDVITAGDHRYCPWPRARARSRGLSRAAAAVPARRLRIILDPFHPVVEPHVAQALACCGRGKA